MVIRVFSGRGWNPSGLPFSPLAFVLAVELLAIKIRHCENIKGLNYWNARNGFLESIIKFALYIDDLTLFLKDEQDMQQALGILAECSTFSVLLVVNKTALTPFLDLYGSGDSKFLVCILPVTNVLLELKRTGWGGWKTLKE